MPHKYTIEQLNKLRPKPTKLTAVYYLPFEKKKATKVMCKCECGGNRIVAVGSFVSNETHSCGCVNPHGHKFNTMIKGKETPLYKRYHGMMDRCYNPNVRSYKSYGAKGVTVCDEWRHNFQQFAEWASNNGFSKELQLDKDIKCGKGNKIYSPETCTFITPELNARTRAMKFIVFGVEMSVSEMCFKYNLQNSTVYKHLIKRKIPLDFFLISQGITQDT